MRIGANATLPDQDNYLRFLKQYGINDVALSYTSHPEYQSRFSAEAADKAGAFWDFPALLRARKQCEDAGLNLVSIENPLPIWCYEQIILGQAGRDQQIENVAETVRNMGAGWRSGLWLSLDGQSAFGHPQFLAYLYDDAWPRRLPSD